MTDDILNFVLVKSSDHVQIPVRIENDEIVYQDMIAEGENDGANLLNLASQINWGIRRKRKYRDDAGQMMVALRNLNLAEAANEYYQVQFPISRGVASQIYEMLVKEDCTLKGAFLTQFATKFEKWYIDQSKVETQTG